MRSRASSVLHNSFKGAWSPQIAQNGLQGGQFLAFDVLGDIHTTVTSHAASSCRCSRGLAHCAASAPSSLPAAGAQPGGRPRRDWHVTQRQPLVQQRSFAAAAVAQECDKQVLYKGRGMQLFRVLVRLKVFQLAGVAGLAVPITTVLSGAGEVSGLQAVVCAALVVGSGAASTALWFYSRRYVGELSLLRLRGAGGASASPGAGGSARAAAAAEGEPLVRLSVLDFWGNREDNEVPLHRFVPPMAGLPPAARAAMAAEVLIPVDVEGDRQYYVSVRYGQLVDSPTLGQLLSGELPEQVAAADAADAAAAAADHKALGGAATR